MKHNVIYFFEIKTSKNFSAGAVIILMLDIIGNAQISHIFRCDMNILLKFFESPDMCGDSPATGKIISLKSEKLRHFTLFLMFSFLIIPRFRNSKIANFQFFKFEIF